MISWLPWRRRLGNDDPGGPIATATLAKPLPGSAVADAAEANGQGPAVLAPAIEVPPERPGPAAAAVPVHVLRGDAIVRCRGGRLMIEQPEAETIERPLAYVAAVHVHGWATVTPGCIAQLLEQGSPVVWRSASGYPIGISSPLDAAGLAARRAQYQADEETALAIARDLVTAKIENMREVVRRRQFDARDRLRRTLELAARKTRRAKSIAMLLGHEGAATAQYFASFNALLGPRAGELTFETRTRRPPRDAVNTLLSYAYAVLLGECLCAAAASGLDPRLGFLHAERAGRAALALDLMEPFRAPIADAAVLAGLNRGQFDETGFEPRCDGSIRMSDANRRTLIAVLEHRLDAETADRSGGTEPGTGPSPLQSFRQTVGQQARGLAAALQRGAAFRAWRLS